MGVIWWNYLQGYGFSPYLPVVANLLGCNDDYEGRRKIVRQARNNLYNGGVAAALNLKKKSNAHFHESSGPLYSFDVAIAFWEF